MKIHSASAFPRQRFCGGWQNFILTASVFTLVTSAKTSTISKFLRLLSLLNISQRMRSIMSTITNIFSRQKLCFKNNFGCFI